MENVNRKSIRERLNVAVSDIWTRFLEHPFVKGIGDGSLDPKKFAYYLIQDYLYVRDYARVYSIGAAKAIDPALIRLFSEHTSRTLGEGDTVHREYMTRFGITSNDINNARQAQNNLSYTHYMLAIAYQEGVAEIIAAILPCAWSYAEIGLHLAAIPGAREHSLFGHWIKTYSSEGFQVAHTTLLSKLEELTYGYDEARLRRLEEIFRRSTIYEGEFWDMGWRGNGIS
jgi:thiaminase/transcriptional activator TenA